MMVFFSISSVLSTGKKYILTTRFHCIVIIARSVKGLCGVSLTPRLHPLRTNEPSKNFFLLNHFELTYSLERNSEREKEKNQENRERDEIGEKKTQKNEVDVMRCNGPACLPACPPASSLLPISSRSISHGEEASMMRYVKIIACAGG